MKKVYLIGIGGIAMANLACLLKKKGFLVSGSDIGTFGPSAKLLKDHKIEYLDNHGPSHIIKFKPDLVITGNAIQRGNSSLEYVLNEKIPYCSMPEAIKNLLLRGKVSIVVAGTSGKTTTTSILAWILEDAGLKPTALIGGILKNTDTGYLSGKGACAVVEGDEYNSAFYDINPKFIHYLPYHAIITNVQEDHLDIYGNINNIVTAFKKLPKLLPSEGSLVLNKNNRYTKALADESKAKVITFGKKGDLDAKNIKYSPDGISFEVSDSGKKLGPINSPLLGDHNVENMLASIAMALNLKISFAKITSALAKFKGVKRRLEIIHQKKNVTVIDDFAHNPDKVSASLSALKKHFSEHRIIAIFEPRTGSSRRKFFQKVYPAAFKLADTVYIAEPYKKESLKGDAFSHTQLVKDLNAKKIEAYAFSKADEIIGHISKTGISAPTVIVVMTSGEFDGIHRKLVMFS
jgi:UDP-N-acetylmuramate: L-alanyl-gamma-D-glutamyl-meso-diaminopimelate ligase